jgi:hypothetical protein
MSMPQFTATRALMRSSIPLATDGRRRHPVDRTTPLVVPADVPGGPGNVPEGYNRECERVPYFVCDLRGCRIEYGWVCTYTPIRRA